jgi:hypothetical protein
MFVVLYAVPVVLVATLSLPAQTRGVVTGVELNPSPAAADAAVTATATGTNPCGAVPTVRGGSGKATPSRPLRVPAARACGAAALRSGFEI